MAQDEIAEFADLWALMYSTMAREMVDSFGEEGKKALIRAIQNYGKIRGERLRKRHEEEGRPINMRSLFDHYDLPGHPETEKDRASNGEYVYAHAILPHGPYVMDAKGRFNNSLRRKEVYGYDSQVECAFRLLLKFLYELSDPLRKQVELIATEVYGADGVEYTPEATKKAE